MRKHCFPVHNWIGLLFVTILLLLQLVSGDQQAEDHRIQRRFMWQQMDNSVMGGLMGRMFKGPARAMKSMFGDLLPSTAGYAKSMMDFLPTETTRVKYIIRDPHTNKPMKIIKMRGAHKKLVKMMRPLPKPAVTEPSLQQYENRMRQLEKEQEMIVEGKVPMSSDEALMDKYFNSPKSHSTLSNSNSNEIISGKIMEYQSWKPVYKSGEHPTSFVTSRPQPLTRLHTNIVASHENYGGGNHEMLPKPEKLVLQRPNLKGNEAEAEAAEDEDINDDFEQVEDDNELAKQKGQHQYEVTEHTGEASGEVHQMAPMEGGFVPSHLYHSHSNANSNSNPSPRPRSRFVITPRPTSTTTSTTSTTSTTEAPNYPAGFLKKFRESTKTSNNNNNHKSRSRHRDHQQQQLNINKDNTENVSFAMSSLRARLQEQQRLSKQEKEMEAALEEAMHGEKWPTEVQQGGSYLTSPIGPSAVAFEQPFKLPRTANEYKRQRKDLRQRGSIKFNDNPNFDEM
ncbi:hypothetical protein ACLKA7_013737 [Drosophila subpalustris]